MQVIFYTVISGKEIRIKLMSLLLNVFNLKFLSMSIKFNAGFFFYKN